MASKCTTQTAGEDGSENTKNGFGDCALIEVRAGTVLLAHASTPYDHISLDGPLLNAIHSNDLDIEQAFERFFQIVLI